MMAYPSWVAPTPMNFMDSFAPAFQLGAHAAQTRRNVDNVEKVSGYLSGLGSAPQSSPNSGSLGYLGSAGAAMPRATQPRVSSNGALSGSFDAVSGATDRGLEQTLNTQLGNPPAPSGSSRLNDQQRQFVSSLMPAAMEASVRTGIDPRIIVAQAAQETGWGRSAPGNNYFGIKSHGKGGGQTLNTHEYVNGQRVNVADSFRTFGSPQDSVHGYADFILSNQRYRPLMAAQGLDAQLEALQASGYATDPNYSRSVGSIARMIGGGGAELGSPALNAANVAAGQPSQAPAMAFASPGTPMAPAGTLPPREIMQAMFEAPETRDLAISLAQTRLSGMQPPEFTQFQREDGSVWQMNVRTGQMQVLQGAATVTDNLTADQRNFAMAQENPDFAEFIGSGQQNLPADVQEYNWYAEQERAAGRDPLSYLDFANAQRGQGLSVVTNPDGTTTVQMGGSGKPLTEQQSKDAVYATRAAGTLPLINQFGNELTNPIARGVEGDPTGIARGALQSPEFQQAQQAGLEFLQAILRKDTGAAITTQEQNEYGRVYLPQPGDTPEVLAQKQQSRERALNALMAGMAPQAILNMERALSGEAATPQNSAPAAPEAANRGLVQTEITPQRYNDNPTRYQSETPPDDWTGDRNLWPYMTPETRALWQ